MTASEDGQAGKRTKASVLSMDIYEPVEMRRALAKHGVNVAVAPLGVGDYLLSDSICIERKTVSDFLASMYSGRLGFQLQILSSSFAMPFLLIEGRPEYRPRMVNMKSFYGYLSRLVLSSPVGLLQTPDMPTSALLISLMFEKIGQGPTKPRLRPRKAHSQTEGALRVLESLPGIGPVLSVRLLQQFKTLRNLFQAPQGEIAKVRGLGNRKAIAITELLDHPFQS